jgi:hypothetical protein
MASPTPEKAGSHPQPNQIFIYRLGIGKTTWFITGHESNTPLGKFATNDPLIPRFSAVISVYRQCVIFFHIPVHEFGQNDIYCNSCM